MLLVPYNYMFLVGLVLFLPASLYLFKRSRVFSLVCLFAAASYLMMFLWYESWMRYLEWGITTPLIVYGLYRMVCKGGSGYYLASLIYLDILMIGFGALAVYTSSLFFLPSTAAFIALALLLLCACNWEDREPLSIFLVSVWSFYPIVWLIGPNGFDLLGVASVTFFYLCLDLSAKIGFSLWAVWREEEAYVPR